MRAGGHRGQSTVAIVTNHPVPSEVYRSTALRRTYTGALACRRQTKRTSLTCDNADAPIEEITRQGTCVRPTGQHSPAHNATPPTSPIPAPPHHDYPRNDCHPHQTHARHDADAIRTTSPTNGGSGPHRGPTRTGPSPPLRPWQVRAPHLQWSKWSLRVSLQRQWVAASSGSALSAVSAPTGIGSKRLVKKRSVGDS
ncbi:hypothetical protein KEM60_01368 [Austwickia sp. TVS 96-490-7B]|nr:hypothetical protein [Austwickia sp. TVS 96-490-7B]